MSVPLILASQSPRRRQLLSMLGYPFEVMDSGADETLPEGAEPAEAARTLAVRKAGAAAARRPDAIVIGADTMVVCGRHILGKPADKEDAGRMLSMLSGRSHRVLTGVCVLGGGKRRTAVEETRVFFTRLSPADIEAYVATGEPMDKAGAYAIQGGAGRYIRRIEGCWYNVVGLPLATLDGMLRDFRMIDIAGAGLY